MLVFSRFATAAALIAAGTLLTALPASADHRPQKVPAPFGLQQVDRDRNGDISRKEWNWAEKHGYDRLSRHDGHVTRKTYQAALNRYLNYVRWRQASYDRDNRWDDRRNDWDNNDRGYGQAPWELGHR